MLLVAMLIGTLWAAAPLRAEEPFKLGIVTFLSGPAAGAFGIPARNAAELIVEAVNAGGLPAPYNTAGVAGTPIEPVLVDEAGSTTQQVAEFRNLVQRRGVGVVVGYISSGNCLAIAPVAEELRTLTILYTCGTPRVFEEASYKYVFRTASHATMDSVGAARYLLTRFPQVRTYAGINQNYAWGQDSWRDFNLAMQALRPESKVVTEQFPKLFVGQFNSEISALLVSQPEVVHSSLWGADVESFIYQATARGLPQRMLLVLSAGESSMSRLGPKLPDGVIIGARGPYGLFARPTPLNQWFREAYLRRYGVPPTYPSYQMAQALLGLKIAYDKAAEKGAAQTKAPPAGGRARPRTEEVIATLEHLTYESFGGTVRMALGKGHQAITEIAYGRSKYDPAAGEATVVDVIRFPAECVNPPEGVDSIAWIKGGMAGARCE